MFLSEFLKHFRFVFTVIMSKYYGCNYKKNWTILNGIIEEISKSIFSFFFLILKKKFNTISACKISTEI